MNEKKEKAKLLIASEEYDAARLALISLFEKDAGDAEICFLLGECFFKIGDISNAVRFYQRAAEILPHKREFFLALGSAYEAFGEEHRAIEAYLRVLELSPEYLFVTERLMALMRSEKMNERVI